MLYAMGGLFLFTSVFADSTNVGLKLSTSTMTASGTSTDNDAATITHAAKEADFMMPSIFVEREFNNGGKFAFVLGLDLVPLSAEIGNAISNDGDALFPAIALAPKAAIIATLYSAIPAFIFAYGYMFLFE